ncbi:MAG: shikimate dehydrogenase [Bacteroidales bacterium]|nr:shikimate dehydrogenase [Bacteroidales bacterium]
MSTLYGLLGYPLGHSFSARFFADKFAAEGIDAEYRNFETPEVAAFVPDLVRREPTLRGLNVTIPHKLAVLPLLDTLSDEARQVGAVNVIRIVRRPDGSTRLVGHNADIVGFRESLRPLLRPHHTRALVLGTGGASLAVVAALRQLHIAPQYVSRTAGNGRLGYADLTPEVMADHTVVVNCTPLGMYPKTEACPPIPYDELTERHLLFDLVYNPLETLFLRRGAAQGAQVKNGLEMLHLQALESWRIWQMDDTDQPL